MNDARNCTESCEGSRDRSERRHCVSFNVGTSTSNISTREGAFHLISKHREVVCQTRDTVLHPMFKNTEMEYYIKHVMHCFIWYPNTDKYYISNTRRSRSSDIKHEEECFISYPNTENYQTREGVFHLISKHRGLICQTRGRVFYLISQHRELPNTRRSVSSDTKN